MIGYAVEDPCVCHGWLWQTQHLIWSTTALKLFALVSAVWWGLYLFRYFRRAIMERG